MSDRSATIVLDSVPDVAIRVNRHPRAKRISLRVSALDGRVTLTMPRFATDRQAEQFAKDHSDWISTAVRKQDAPVDVGLGTRIPVEGRHFDIVAGNQRSARFSGDTITASAQATGIAVRELLKATARDRLSRRSAHYADAVGREIARITLRDTRSRWGSCSQEGNLMYSWRLVMAPVDVLDYVAAHEVAHLVEMNHSPAFWAVVADLCPGFEAPRRWLRHEGHRLHRFRFEGHSNG